MVCNLCLPKHSNPTGELRAACQCSCHFFYKDALTSKLKLEPTPGDSDV